MPTLMPTVVNTITTIMRASLHLQLPWPPQRRELHWRSRDTLYVCAQGRGFRHKGKPSNRRMQFRPAKEGTFNSKKTLLESNVQMQKSRHSRQNVITKMRLLISCREESSDKTSPRRSRELIGRLCTCSANMSEQSTALSVHTRTQNLNPSIRHQQHSELQR